MRRKPKPDSPRREVALVLFTVGLLLAQPKLQAQHWSDGLLPGADWAQAKADFDSTWSDSLPAKGKGFKPFQRWWHFAEKRWAFDAAGQEPFHSNSPWLATQAERAGRQARTTPLPTVWSPATPSGLPLHNGAGRVNRLVIDPNDSSRWIACAPSGGVWQTSDSGDNWSLLGTSDWAGMGVSDVAFHPENPGHVLVATGDADFGSAYGVGLMETTDGGQNWEPTGLGFGLSDANSVSRVHRMAGDPDHILAATTDGIWISTDGGDTFENTLEGLCSDLLPHPGDSSVWHAALRPGEIVRSTDGGASWAPVSGLPNPFGISRFTLATSPVAPNEVWAIAARSSTQGLEGIYLSIDSGASYTEIPDVPNLLGYTVNGMDLGGQGFYDLALAVDPLDPDRVVAGGINLWETRDRGETWNCLGHWFGGDSVPLVHADHHALTFVPGTSDVLSAHDGGVARVTEQGIQDRSDGLDIGQVYRLGFSENRLDRLLTGWQDNGVNQLDRGIHAQVLGADGFHCMIHPEHPDTLYAAEYYGRTFRSPDGGWSWQEWIGGSGEGVHERGDWDTPMQFAPGDPGRAFVAKRRLYHTTDDGATWSQSNALPGDQIEVLALTPAQDSLALVAKGALAFFTEDLQNWNPLPGMPGLPITDAVLHPDSAGVWWFSFGGYDAENRVWKTTDGGSSWSSVGTGLPALPVNTMVMDEATGDLYAGTDAGVYVRATGSGVWDPYKAGLPEVLCSDLGIRKSTGELLLATYGRGLWKAPLRELPDRDGAALHIEGAGDRECGAIPNVRLVLRNAGTDTLVAATVVWAGMDTVDYGFVLPPNRVAELPWPNVLPDALPYGTTLQARLANVVGVTGSVQDGLLTSGPDAVAENDVVEADWRHRALAGPVFIRTLSDCKPLELSWALLDSAGTRMGEGLHFAAEQWTTDTLCLVHGDYTIQLHDLGDNGVAGAECGMTGTIDVMALGGGTIWSVLDANGPGPGFSDGSTGSFLLPVSGFNGCTDPEACNFDPAASTDNGACDYACPNPSCPGDVDGDGVHGATDILVILSQFGCTADCTWDITGDGTVSTHDILALLALYGETCSD